MFDFSHRQINVPIRRILIVPSLDLARRTIKAPSTTTIVMQGSDFPIQSVTDAKEIEACIVLSVFPCGWHPLHVLSQPVVLFDLVCKLQSVVRHRILFFSSSVMVPVYLSNISLSFHSVLMTHNILVPTFAVPFCYINTLLQNTDVDFIVTVIRPVPSKKLQDSFHIANKHHCRNDFAHDKERSSRPVPKTVTMPSIIKIRTL